MLAASIAGAIASMDWRIPTHATLLAGGMLLIMASVAQVWPLHLSTKVKITVDDLPIFAAALLLPPFDAMLVAGASTLIGLRFRNTRMRWYNRGFNAAATALGTGAAALTYAVLHGSMPPTMASAIGIIAAGIAKY